MHASGGCREASAKSNFHSQTWILDLHVEAANMHSGTWSYDSREACSLARILAELVCRLHGNQNSAV